jgi:predicted RNase H-like HicB family nuclease
VTTTVQIRPPKFNYATVVREDYATDGSRTIVAEIPALVGCMSHGDTPEEALRNLEEAAELYFEALGDHPPLVPETETPLPRTSGTGSEGAYAVGGPFKTDITVDLKIELVR